MIIQLLYPLIFAEMLIILILLFRTPLRKLLLKGLDHLKHGRGPVVTQTLMATLLVVFISNLYGLAEVQKRLMDAGVGTANPTDQVLMAYNLLEASLLGFSLFLALMIDRLHYYLNEIRLQRKALEDYQLQDGKRRQKEEIHASRAETSQREVDQMVAESP
ncbi:hypothetical protein Ancab_004411 [Ancistrocladus abbreviatus]